MPEAYFKSVHDHATHSFREDRSETCRRMQVLASSAVNDSSPCMIPYGEDMALGRQAVRGYGFDEKRSVALRDRDHALELVTDRRELSLWGAASLPKPPPLLSYLGGYRQPKSLPPHHHVCVRSISLHSTLAQTPPQELFEPPR